MDKEFLESSEFYSARFKNFSTLLIMPIAVLLCLVCIFSFFGKREITIEGQGDLTTNKQIPILQASTNSVLKQNYLKEGKFVKKGQTLLVYQNTKNQNQKRLLEKQQDNLSYQITSLETLKASIRSNQDQFENNDQFGYRDLLRGYLDQRQVYLIENQMVTDKAATSTTKQQTLTAIIDKTIQRDQTNLDAYQALYQSIKTNKVYSSTGKYNYLYENYQTKVKAMSDKNEQSGLKADILATTQQQIDSLQGSIANAENQKVSIKEFDDSRFNTNTNNEKLALLEAQQTQSANEQLVKAKQSLVEIQTTLKQITSDSKEYVVKAPKDGVLHVDDHYQGIKYTSAGTSMARIYPVLADQKRLKIEALIPVDDISSVKIGQRLRLKITRNVPRPIIIEGKINQISVSPTVINQGSYYTITGLATISNNNRKLLHYGMTGKIAIITGKTTFFNYYKDKLLNRN